MSAAASDECESRAVVMHTSFGRDPFVQGAHRMLASSDPLQAKLLSMYLGQVQMVARGEDLRKRTIRDLGTRNLACVGPSTAVALTVLQPPAGGKTLGTRPAYKGMLRSKLPELCGIGALFRWLCVRLAVLGESIPRPGKLKFKRFFLWPGRNGGSMSYTQHANLMQKLFADLGVETSKLTHELRIFAAQLLYKMGVPLEVIQRIGHWLLDAFGTAYIVPGFTAEALLALAFWPGAAQKDFGFYWAARFHASVDEELIELVMPGLTQLERDNAAAAAAGRAASKAATHLAKVLRVGATVVVQDALELAEQFPNNPVHQMLLKNQTFKEQLTDFKSYKRLGGFKPMEPLGVRDMITQQTQQLQHMASTLSKVFGGPIAHLSRQGQLNWPALDKQLQDAAALEQQTRAFQPQPLDAAAELAKLSNIAAGKVKPSEQFLQQVRQPEDVLAADGDSADGGSADACSSDSGEVEDQDRELQEQEAAAPAAKRHRRGARLAAGTEPLTNTTSAAAAAAAAAGGAAAQAAAQPAASNADAAAAPPQPAAAQHAAAAAAVAGSSQRAPTAAQHAAAAAAAAGSSQRAPSPEVHVTCEAEEPTDAGPSAFTTPSGKKYTPEQMYSRSELDRTPGGHMVTFFTRRHLEQLQQQQQQEQQEQQQQEGSSMPLVPYVLQQQQQQAQQQHQELLGLLGKLLDKQHSAAAHEQQPATATAGSAGDGELQLLRQQLKAQQQQLEALQQQQQQQQHAAAAQLVGTLSSQYASRLGGVDPVGSIMQPWISSQPALNAVLGAANNSSMLPGVQNNGPSAAELMAVLDMRDQRLAQRVAAEVVAQMQGSSPAAAAAAAAVAVGGHAGSGSGAPAAAPAAVGKPAKVMAFPVLGQHSTLAELAGWYYNNPLRNTGKTPQELEAADAEWRGGKRGPRWQRWAEYEQLLRKIEGHRQALLEDLRSTSHNPQKVQVDHVKAARELDRERESLQLSVCEYREYVVGATSSKGYKKGKAAAEQLQQRQQEEAAGPAVAAAAAAGVPAQQLGQQLTSAAVEQQSEQQQQSAVAELIEEDRRGRRSSRGGQRKQ